MPRVTGIRWADFVAAMASGPLADADVFPTQEYEKRTGSALAAQFGLDGDTPNRQAADERYPTVVNVAAIAVGDGVTDDTAAIAAAITASGTNGLLYFGDPGNETKTYLVTGLTPAAGQHWSGKATLKLKSGSTNRLVNIVSAGVTLDGLTLDANGVAVDAIRVTSSAATDTRLLNLTVSNATGSSTAGINITTSSARTLISGCDVSNCRWGIICNGASTDIKIANCRVRTCTATSSSEGSLYLPNCARVEIVNTSSVDNLTHGVYLATAASDVSFTNCHFRNNGNGSSDHRGVSVNGATRVSFVGCHSQGNQEGGFYVLNTSVDIAFSGCHAVGNNVALRAGGHGFELNGKGVSATACVASGQLGDAANEGNGFAVNGTSVVLSACVARNNYSTGFRVTGAVHVALSSCSAYNNSQRGAGNHDGFELSSSSTDVTVSGCIAYDDQGTKTQRYGLAVSGTVDWYVIVNNILRGNATSSLADTGGSNKTASGNLT